MELVSLIIMIIGLVALVAIYVISRMSRKDMPQNRKLPPIPTLRDEHGEETSSVLEDQPARDGKKPSHNAHVRLKGAMPPPSGLPPEEEGDPAPSETPPPPETPPPAKPQQFILFIAAGDDDFAGANVLDALDEAGLVFGEMNLYHRMVLGEGGEDSLFYVANGVKPWTLVPEELAVSNTPGLSLILNLPSPVSDREAIHDFVRTADQINARLGGTLKNQQQEAISEAERQAFLALG